MILAAAPMPFTASAILSDGALKKQSPSSTKKTLAGVAIKVLLLADHLKFGVSVLCLCLPLHKTDDDYHRCGSPAHAIDSLVVKGKEVMIVDTKTQQIAKHYTPR